MEQISLGDCQTITDEGIKNMLNIKKLILVRNNRITDEGIKNMINM